MSLSQKGRRTQIRTVLDRNSPIGEESNLVLTSVQGAESFSQPYTIDLKMYARPGLDFLPSQLINTPATVRLRVEELTAETATFQVRKGIFQNLARVPRQHFRSVQHDLASYIGRLVPAFQVMAQEVRYRVFENITVADLIQRCMVEFQGLKLDNYIDPNCLNALRADPDLKDPLEHAVQYGESTFNFLSRLMNRSSIWYNFKHDGTGEFETMILGKGPASDPAHCTVYQNFVDPRDLPFTSDMTRWQIVYNPTRTFTPAPKLVRVGEFNTVMPTQPLLSQDGSKTIVAAAANIISAEFGSEAALPDASRLEPQTSFIQESFPDLGAASDDDVTRDAQTALEIAEAQVEVLSGLTSNGSFLVGRSFSLTQGADEGVPDKTYLITQLSYAAYDRNYLYLVRPNDALGLGALLDDVFWQPVSSLLDSSLDTQSQGAGQGPDGAGALAVVGSVNYVQQWRDYVGGLDFSVSSYTGRSKPAAVINYASQITANTAAAMGGLAMAFVPQVTKILQDLAQLIQTIINIVLWPIFRVVEGLGFAILGLVAFVQWLAHKPTLLDGFRQGLHAVEEKTHRLLNVFLKPIFVDGYSGNFAATQIEREGQRRCAGIPLPVAQRTQVFGPHLAVVIGPTGINQPADVDTTAMFQLYADKLGRVRIRFPWDRSPKGLDGVTTQGTPGKPQYATNLGAVWARVSDAWAGVGYGTQFLPRVGDEVIVSFIDGDPDRPIVTGRVYSPRGTDKSNLPFSVPGPLKTELEKDETDQVASMNDLTKIRSTQDFSRSGLRTQLVGQRADQPDGFHMLRFDDKFDDAQVLLRADGRYDLTAFRSMFQTVHGNLHLRTVQGRDKDNKTYGGAMFTSVGGEYDLVVGGARYEDVTKEYNLTVKADTVMDLQANATVMVKATAALNAHDIVIEARNQITLKVGNSFIVITPAMVQISGAMVQINSGGSPASSPSPTITDAAGAAKADPGEPPDWIKIQPHVSGGGSRTRTLVPQHGALVAMGSDGMLAIGSNGKIKVSPADPAFANGVVSNVERMAEKDPSTARFNDPSAPVVTVQQPNPPTNPPTASTVTNPDGSKTLSYDPKDWPRPGDPTSPSGDDILKQGMTQ